ncbi:glycosyl transferase [Sphingobium algorifonticola]|uniref:Glycosyl transferase n=1 Tax=Sphingobium algorifonticola TaxID=2008318 RepID=A0A437JBW8_9SPHN|nr:glycosyl transferase [Sphingobium algorifonticola]RVT43385.1 glycosyl transferase [Sphingobium algorifonticola]
MSFAEGPSDGRTAAPPEPIAFLAIAEAHQVPHWLPVALRLAADPAMAVSVLSPSCAILDMVAAHDPAGRLRPVRLRRPSLRPDSLFDLPSRLATLLANYRIIAAAPTIVTTEVSSALLRSIPGFRARLIQIKHGAGDREGGYRGRHAAYDLTLVAGEKDKAELIARGLATAENCVVTGYAKAEMMAQPVRLFDSDRPVVLYNPHFDRRLSSWMRHGPAVLRCLETLHDFSIVIAPHVKMARAARPIVTAAPHIRVDMGSARSIDMSYTAAADIYLGDVSSQVYEFLLRPRPCVFLNLDRIDHVGDKAFAHWQLGEVVTDIADLPAALRRAPVRHHDYRAAQQAAVAHSIDLSPVPASQRQADAIRAFLKKSATGAGR